MLASYHWFFIKKTKKVLTSINMEFIMQFAERQQSDFNQTLYNSANTTIQITIQQGYLYIYMY